MQVQLELEWLASNLASPVPLIKDENPWEYSRARQHRYLCKSSESSTVSFHFF